MQSITELLINYGPNALAFIIALIYLVKDWESFKTRYLRFIAIFAIILLCILGIGSTYSTNKSNAGHRIEDKTQIRALQKSMSTSININRDNTKQFSDNYGKLYQRVSDLQSNIKNAGLREEADKLKTELVSTQKALIPQKAILSLTLNHPNVPNLEALRMITLPVKNNVVHVEFNVLNNSTVSARNGEFTLRICDACEFISEPKNFKSLSGQSKTERTMQFERILPKTFLETMSADIKVPPYAPSFEIGATYRCENCDFPEHITNLCLIKLSR